jgi:hypothetical protein
LAVVALFAACESDHNDANQATAVDDTSASSGATGSTDRPAEAPSEQSTDATVTDSVAPASTTTAEAVIEISNPPGSSDAEGALADVDGLECAAGGGQWSATGQVANPTDAIVDYRIYVSFLDTAGETLALIETGADNVEPGNTAEWSAEFDSSALELRCVLRVERFAS